MDDRDEAFIAATIWAARIRKGLLVAGLVLMLVGATVLFALL